MQFLSKVRPDAKLVLGLSGGVDSMLLFSVLRALGDKITFRVVHIVHGKERSDEDALALVIKTCKFNDIKCTVEYAYCANESDGRQKRMAYYKDNLREGEVLVLGHHIDDSIETVLINLFQGATVNGLGGIAGETIVDGIKILRPFITLGYDKATIRTMAKRHSIEFVEDTMNDDMKMKRNIIRRVILPLISGNFPSAKTKIYEFIESCNKQKKLNGLMYVHTDKALFPGQYTKSIVYPINALKRMLDTETTLAELENWFFHKMRDMYNLHLSKRHVEEFIVFIKQENYLTMSLPEGKSLTIKDNYLMLAF